MSLSAGLSNLMLVSNEIANKVVRTVNRSGGGVSRHGNLEVGQLEYEAMMRVLDNLVCEYFINSKPCIQYQPTLPNHVGINFVY